MVHSETGSIGTFGGGGVVEGIGVVVGVGVGVGVVLGGVAVVEGGDGGAGVVVAVLRNRWKRVV